MTTEIAKTYRLVVVENLNIKGMNRNRKLALADAEMGEVLRRLKYKAERLVEVSRWYASSKTCSDCGHINHELALSDRQWTCAGCGVLHGRDWNASKNILQEGLRAQRAPAAAQKAAPVVATSGLRGPEGHPGQRVRRRSWACCARVGNRGALPDETSTSICAYFRSQER
jgi:transposase